MLRDVELSVEHSEVLRAVLLQHEWAIRIGRNSVSHVLLRTVRAGDVPAAPAFLEGRSMIHRGEKRSGKGRCSISAWKHRCESQSGCPFVSGAVTEEAFDASALEARSL